MSETRFPYIIMAPPERDDSAGVRVLHTLRRHLEAQGYPATIQTTGKAPENAIVVYPETVPGNPLRGRTVVRYLLHHPGALGGDPTFPASEILFACNGEALRQYVPADDRILCVPVIEEIFHDAGLPRHGACVYIGKGAHRPRLPVTDGLPELRGLPRAEVARRLQTAECLYTYDAFSMIVHEARRCGCPVVSLDGPLPIWDYADHVREFSAQLAAFCRITQAAAAQGRLRIGFGALVNDFVRLDMVLKRSEIVGRMHVVEDPESATIGLNRLLDTMAAAGDDVAVLTHQDMDYRALWLDHIRAQIALLPASWMVAGIIGKDLTGRICGRFHDTRIVPIFDTADIHTFPQPACCFDECCLLVNLRSGFRFDETLRGFDLYGTLCVLQTWERGGTAWIVDSGAYTAWVPTRHGPCKIEFALAQHRCLRPFTWFPDEAFCANFKWLHERFPNAPRIDTTVLGVPRHLEAAAAERTGEALDEQIAAHAATLTTGT